jgi:hypothetical protein
MLRKKTRRSVEKNVIEKFSVESESIIQTNSAAQLAGHGRQANFGIGIRFLAQIVVQFLK